MKSKIRSRWHRANEKPLENDGTPAPTAPMGEINPASLSVLTDDLSNVKPPKNNGDRSRNHEPRNGRRNDRGKQGNRRSQPKNNRNPNQSEKSNESLKEDDSKKPYNQSKRRARKRRQHQGKQASENSKQTKTQNNKPHKSAQSTDKKATGLKGFLGKLFG